MALAWLLSGCWRALGAPRGAPPASPSAGEEGAASKLKLHRDGADAWTPSSPRGQGSHCGPQPEPGRLQGGRLLSATLHAAPGLAMCGVAQSQGTGRRAPATWAACWTLPQQPHLSTIMGWRPTGHILSAHGKARAPGRWRTESTRTTPVLGDGWPPPASPLQLWSGIHRWPDPEDRVRALWGQCHATGCGGGGRQVPVALPSPQHMVDKALGWGDPRSSLLLPKKAGGAQQT